MVSARRIDSESVDSGEFENPYEGMEVQKIGTKEILGYKCQGYQMENDEYILTYYITDEAEVSFHQMQQAQQAENFPKGFQTDWFEEENPMMMEMDMVNKKNPEANVVMRVSKIENKPVTIRTAEYQSF